MAIAGHRSTLILIALAAVLGLGTPAHAGTDDGTDEGCVNVEYAFWGGPLTVRPYLNNAIGIQMTEDSVKGGELTLSLVVIPSLCGPTPSTGLIDYVAQAKAFNTNAGSPIPAPDSGLPLLP